MQETKTVELRFHLVGKSVPVDHGYNLYGALCRHLEWLHEVPDVGIALIRGMFGGSGTLLLQPISSLNIRTSLEHLPQFLTLAGKQLKLGRHSIRVGVPNTFMLTPAAALYAHLVTTRNGENEDRFDAEVKRQLEILDIHGTYTRGPRRTFRVHEKQIVGYSVFIDQLTAEESIRLQEVGLGGRRKMGCGIFVPRKD